LSTAIATALATAAHAEAILIVDDNPANLKVAKFALQAEGFDVRTATDAEEALMVLKEFLPRLILMDIQLPGMDGLALTRRLKADPKSRGILIVAVTAYAMKGDREKALGAGCDGYLTKPVDPIQLPVLVGELLGRPSVVPRPARSAARTMDAAPSTTAVREASPGTVLVVEDNHATRKMFRVTLETAGFQVIEAEDGRSALTLAAQRRPDLCVLDLGLPDMSGFDLARALRELFGQAPVPMVCVTGFLARLDEARTLEGGFAQVLVKPIDPFLLLEVVKTHVASPGVVTAPIGEGRTLLVVDDDPLHRKVAHAWFLSAGFHVLEASDGVAALALARREHPCAIVSDVLMPGMDGFELCLAVRRDRELGVTPVILLSSAYTEAADQALASQVGATAFLLKTDGLEGAAHAVAAALATAPSTPASEPIELIEGERTKRALLQLDKQIQNNMRLRQRVTFQEAELAVLAGVTAALSQSKDEVDLLGEALTTCLDMAGLSKGAFYVMDSHPLLLKHQIGFSHDEIATLRVVFACEAFLAEMAARGNVVCVPSPSVPADVAQKLLLGAGVTSVLLVPVACAGATYGLMVLGASTAEICSEEALSFARVLGTQMGQAFALARAFTGLRASEARYRTLTENANDAVAILTPQGTLREVNRRFTQILGYTAEQLVGRSIAELAAPGLEQENVERYKRMVAEGRGQTTPVALAKADGGVALMEFSTARVQVGGEQIVFSIGRDVTEQVQARNQLMVSDRMASVGTLASSVAHEINNPLAAMLANVDFAIQDSAEWAHGPNAPPRTVEVQEALRDARECAERVRNIVKDLKIFSRTEEDRLGPVDTRLALESALRMASNEIKHRARLVKAYGKVPPVEGNESRLGQVFLNLIVNAVQAMDEGRADSNELRVTTRTGPSGRIDVEIGDTGPGMGPETLQKLFTPFFSTKPAGMGTGLGLAICHRIVNGMGGEISVESKLGVGTVFKVSLRAAHSEAKEAVATPAVSPVGRRGRVLMIDDEKMMGKAVQRMLASEHEVQVFTSAREALDCIVGGQRFDVILCDMMMPVLTGMDFYELLLEQVPGQAERIVFLTGGAFTQKAREFLERVASARLEKPFELQRLRALVNEGVKGAAERPERFA
jgi:PAS domain S-box-containing protein